MGGTIMVVKVVVVVVLMVVARQRWDGESSKTHAATNPTPFYRNVYPSEQRTNVIKGCDRE